MLEIIYGLLSFCVGFVISDTYGFEIKKYIKNRYKQDCCTHYWCDNLGTNEVYCNKCWKVIKLPKRGNYV